MAKSHDLVIVRFTDSSQPEGCIKVDLVIILEVPICHFFTHLLPGRGRISEGDVEPDLDFGTGVGTGIAQPILR
eukprot:745637-Rhodomonas_salina.1